MAKNKPVRYQLKVDVQCGACGTLTHLQGEDFPKFCPCCGAIMERYCLACQKRADMFFEEWWPEEGECVRTYTPAKRCSRCNALLEEPQEHPGYQH
ncbi:MAG TPA: hypothetical protein DEB40_13870 [Elusimicrobia bacterium]|nr:hypothetical protein [Elusimicrobiota bacterium]HBT62821.1 hypothetical protein [Elusimicrobiota bacterium]